MNISASRTPRTVWMRAVRLNIMRIFSELMVHQKPHLPSGDVVLKAESLREASCGLDKSSTKPAHLQLRERCARKFCVGLKGKAECHFYATVSRTRVRSKGLFFTWAAGLLVGAPSCAS